MFFPTSTSAMSIERISKAVPESRPLARTVFVQKGVGKSHDRYRRYSLLI